jgi:hypothetical protein
MSNKENSSRKPGTADNEQSLHLGKISRLLEILVRLNLETMRGGRSQAEMILVLDSLGCRPTEIAGLLGTTQNTVNVTLSKYKKKNRKK